MSGLAASRLARLWLWFKVAIGIIFWFLFFYFTYKYDMTVCSEVCAIWGCICE